MCMSERLHDHLKLFHERLVSEGEADVGDVGLADNICINNSKRKENPTTDLIDVVSRCARYIPLVS